MSGISKYFGFGQNRDISQNIQAADILWVHPRPVEALSVKGNSCVSVAKERLQFFIPQILK